MNFFKHIAPLFVFTFSMSVSTHAQTLEGYVKEDSTIIMQEATRTLPPVEITSNSARGERHRLGFFCTRKPRGGFSANTGLQHAVYIKNTIGHTGIIETVYIQFTRDFWGIDIANIRVRIYAWTEDGIPGDDLLVDNLIIRPKRGSNKIDVSKHNIYFPLEGVFVAIEYMDIENRRHSIMGPTLRCTFVSPNENFTYFSYRNRNWHSFPTDWPQYTGYCNGAIGIRIRAL